MHYVRTVCMFYLYKISLNTTDKIYIFLQTDPIFEHGEIGCGWSGEICAAWALASMATRLSCWGDRSFSFCPESSQSHSCLSLFLLRLDTRKHSRYTIRRVRTWRSCRKERQRRRHLWPTRATTRCRSMGSYGRVGGQYIIPHTLVKPFGSPLTFGGAKYSSFSIHARMHPRSFSSTTEFL